ncbi:MAG: MEDS domain-containing protein [Candidatus Sulfotelmatobacter sp.]
MLRSSPLFQFKHGDHTCVFYRSQSFLQSVLTPYVTEGLRKGERCFCAQKPDVLRKLLYDLRFLGFDTDNEVKRGALELHTQDEVYFPSGSFEPLLLLELLMRSVEDSLKKGFAGFRSAGELAWAAHNDRHCDQLIGYEELVNRCYPGKAATGLCQYAIDDFSPNVLQSVLEHHKMHITDGDRLSCSHTSIDVNYAGYTAEIVADQYLIDPKYYYVIQQKRRSDVLAWGVAPTFEHANANAKQIIGAQQLISDFQSIS